MKNWWKMKEKGNSSHSDIFFRSYRVYYTSLVVQILHWLYKYFIGCINHFFLFFLVPWENVKVSRNIVLNKSFEMKSENCEKSSDRLDWILDYRSIAHPADSPVGNYRFKFSNRNTRRKCEICSKSTIRKPERRQWRLLTFVEIHINRLNFRTIHIF